MKRLSMTALRRLSAAACESDARVVIDLDAPNLLQIRSHDGVTLTMKVSGLREMRLIAKQILQLADYVQDDAPMIEDVE